MGDSQDDHPRRKSVVSLSTPKPMECRRASTTAALATVHIPSFFDLTAFVGVGEPGGINLEISIPQTRQKPGLPCTVSFTTSPHHPSSLIAKIWRVEGKNLPILLRRVQKLTTVMRYAKRSPRSEHVEIVKEASLQDGLRVSLPLGLKLHRVM